MPVVYLDQNKWVDVARAVHDPGAHADLHRMLTRLGPAIERGDIVFPLSMSTLYETYKIGDPERRHRLAHVQIAFSKGRVFRGRWARLDVEAAAVLREATGLPGTPRPDRWFLSDIFLEAFAEAADDRLGGLISPAVVEAIGQHPAHFAYDWIMDADPDHRLQGVQLFSPGARDLLERLEARRARWADLTLAMRKRAYKATLLLDNLDQLLGVAEQIGLPWRTVADMGPKIVKALIRECPTLNAERELTCRLEDQSRALTENDTRDMYAYTAAVPYADVVVGENQFINLARQGGLGQAYGTELTSDLRSLVGLV